MPNNNEPRHVKHAKSNVVQQDGPKLPNPARLEYGEIAINYALGNETISLKNSSNTITTFKPNTNVYVKNFTTPITTQDVCDVLSVGIVNKYQDFNISFLEADDDDMDLFGIIDYIRTTFYNVSDLHVMLNVAKTNDINDAHTNFYVSTEDLQDIIGNEDSKLNNKSAIIGFYKHDGYFIAGDSNAMNGIEFNWDKTTKVMTVRFVYLDSAYRMNGNEIN